MGLALVVVMVSKQAVKVTTGTGEETIMILLDHTGLLETHARLDVITQRTLSLLAGL
jgi:hypothetical protein